MQIWPKIGLVGKFLDFGLRDGGVGCTQASRLAFVNGCGFSRVDRETRRKLSIRVERIFGEGGGFCRRIAGYLSFAIRRKFT